MAGENFFWDSCVFSAFLCDERHAYDLDSIEQFLGEARAGSVTIYASSVSLVEVLPSRMKKAGSFEDFLADYQGAVVPIAPTPNVMTQAGRLRDLPYRKGNSTSRRLSTPDAIMLATALHLKTDYHVTLDAFHTFDSGGKKELDGSKTLPLLGFEDWCEGFNPGQLGLASPIIEMNRCKPIHPRPMLPHVR